MGKVKFLLIFGGAYGRAEDHTEEIRGGYRVHQGNATRGLIKRDIIPADEAVGYEELEKNGSLPDGVYATYENGKRSYCRVESTVPDMTGEEIDRLIQLRKASDLRTIKNWILFFGVMAVIGLCLGGISLFVR